MIVKNESQIISRAIDSVIDIIDSWCIIDTGSSDNTIQIIKEKLSHLPGEVISRPWVNFGHNRTEAFEAAQRWAEWILLIDADMQLINVGFNKSELDETVSNYQILQKNGSLSYYNTRLLNSKLDWKCVGVTHEYFSIDNFSILTKKLNSIWINDIGDGGSKSNKFERDILLLLAGLKEEPNNSRYMFYLAQSYKDTAQYDNAIYWYEKRISSGGWYEEVWYSYYMIALCYIKKGMLKEAEEWVKKGYMYYPKRSEAIYEICKAYRISGDHKKAYEYYLLGKDIPYPKDDLLFISHDVYSDLFEYEMTILHYYLFPQDLLTGLRKTVTYLANSLNHRVYENSKFYVSPISKKSTELDILEATAPSGFLNSSPCYLKTSNGIQITNIRQVNYRIDKTNGKYYYVDSNDEMNYQNTEIKPIRTSNYQLDSGEMREEYLVETYPSKILGLEDIRLFEYNNKVMFLATSPFFNAENKNRIATGEYDYVNNKIIVEKVFKSPTNSNCEKNWVALNSTTLIYSWFPILLYSYPNLELKKSIKSPKIFSYFRGSTNSVKYKDLNWLVVHSVIHEKVRTYLHYLVALTDSGEPVLYSLPFSFEGEKIEYCLSIDIIESNIVFYYSTWDSTAKRMTVPISTFGDMLVLI
jgi:tetratricopeptide (TPR) repeat protein